MCYLHLPDIVHHDNEHRRVAPTASNMRKTGLNSQQIADELSLSQDTIAWLLAGDSNEAPSDVRIGWRTIGVKPARMEALDL